MLQPSTYPAFDSVRFGRRLKAARIMEGYEDLRPFVHELRRRGVLRSMPFSDALATYRAVECGLLILSYPALAEVAALTHPPGGRHFFEEAFDADTQALLDMLTRMEA